VDARTAELTTFYDNMWAAYVEKNKKQWALRPEDEESCEPGRQLYQYWSETLWKGKEQGHMSFPAAQWAVDAVYGDANDNLMKDDPKEIVKFAPFYSSLVDYIQAEGSGPETVTLPRHPASQRAKCSPLGLLRPRHIKQFWSPSASGCPCSSLA